MHYILLVSACVVSTLTNLAQAQVPVIVDIDSEGMDWDPEVEFQHADHTFKNDPWVAVAKALSKTKETNLDVNKTNSMYGIESRDKFLLKALGIHAFRIPPIKGHLARPEDADDIDMVSTQYRSVVPFELRHTPYVWALVVKSSELDRMIDITNLLGMDLSKFKAKLISVPDADKKGYEYQLQGKGLPPFLADAIVFRTSEGVTISGSMIMGAMPIPPSHRVEANRHWLLMSLPK